MKEPQFILIETMHFFDVESGVTISFHPRTGGEWYVRLWYKSDNNVIAVDRRWFEGRPTEKDASAFFKEHQKELDEVFPFEEKH